MTPRDLARVGQLVLDNGMADGRQVVPAEWLAECFVPRVSVNELQRYGYPWYLGDMEFLPAGTVRLGHWLGFARHGGPRLCLVSRCDSTETGRQIAASAWAAGRCVSH